MKPLAIIPTYFTKPSHVNLLTDALKTLRSTSDCDVLIIDDHSEMEGVASILERLAEKYDAALDIRPSNEGFSRTVNVGLKQAYDQGRSGVLVNQDIQFVTPGWLDVMEGDPADIVGAKLLYPNLLIQHGGIYFSLLHQYFDHLFKFAPFNLPESCVRHEVPVTGALQLIRPRAIDKIGFYDEDYRLSYEDVDFCVRAMIEGLTCAMNPQVVAIHHEGMIRQKSQTPKMARWIAYSHSLLGQKLGHVNLAQFAHPLDRKTDHEDSSRFTSSGVAPDAPEKREPGNRAAVAAEAARAAVVGD